MIPSLMFELSVDQLVLLHNAALMQAEAHRVNGNTEAAHHYDTVGDVLDRLMSAVYQCAVNSDATWVNAQLQVREITVPGGL